MNIRVHVAHLVICVILICGYIKKCWNNDCYIEAQADFEITKFLGRWYEWMWIPPSYLFPNESYLDFQHEYSLRKNGDISVHIRGRNPAEMDTCIDDFAILRLTSEPGKLIYERYVAGRVNESNDYWIVKTDYENYAVTYGCRVRKNDICEEADSWVWSRSSSLSQQHLEVVNSVIESICLNVTDYSKTPQSSDCSFSSNGHSVRISIAFFLCLFATTTWQHI